MESKLKNALWPNILRGWNTQESQTVLTLKQVPIFSDLTDNEFKEIEKMVHERNYKPEEYIFKRQAPGEGMYVIMSGQVEIAIGTRTGKKQILAELGAGDFFGELALLDAEARSASAIAKDHSTLLGFFRPDLFSLLERKPELGNKILMNLARVISARLRHTNELLAEAQSEKKG